MRRSEPRRVVILHGHPDPGPDTFCAALTQAYEQSALAAGHEVKTFRVGAIDFPILRSTRNFYGEGAQLPAVLTPCQSAIGRADHLVLVFPIWLGTMPALLKAALEQLFRPGFALSDGDGFPRGLLKGKSGRIVCTMGMPAIAYRLLFRAHGVGNLRRAILGLSGIKPVRSTFIGMAGGDDAAYRSEWVEKMRRLGAKAA